MNDTVNLGLLINSTVFKNYLVCLGILIIKMMVMSPLTTMQRFKHNAFISEEDVRMLGGRVNHSSPDVERVRRAHLNDLESIPIFLFAAFGYMCTNPPVGLAVLLFTVFTVCRIIHTTVYAVLILPQPARGLSWVTGYLITGYMSFVSIKTGFSL